MGDAMEEHRKAVALFRFEVLAPVLSEPSEWTASLIRVQVAEVWDIPGSSRMRGWLGPERWSRGSFGQGVVERPGPMDGAAVHGQSGTGCSDDCLWATGLFRRC